MEINPWWNASGRRDDVIPEPFVLKEGALHMSPLCPFHSVLMNSKTFHTLLTKKTIEKPGAARWTLLICFSRTSWETAKTSIGRWTTGKSVNGLLSAMKSNSQSSWRLLRSIPPFSLSNQPSGVATGCACCAADIESALWQHPEP